MDEGQKASVATKSASQSDRADTGWFHSWSSHLVKQRVFGLVSKIGSSRELGPSGVVSSSLVARWVLIGLQVSDLHSADFLEGLQPG